MQREWIAGDRKGWIGMTSYGRWFFRSFICRGSRWLVIVLAIPIACSGCHISLDPIDEHLVGSYRLLAVDDANNLEVVYDDGGAALTNRIGPVVVEAGWDSRYIVAICRPKGESGGSLSYYYLDIAKDTPLSVYEAVTGPLTEEEFASAMEELGLPEFTLHYPELR